MARAYTLQQLERMWMELEEEEHRVRAKFAPPGNEEAHALPAAKRHRFASHLQPNDSVSHRIALQPIARDSSHRRSYVARQRTPSLSTHDEEKCAATDAEVARIASPDHTRTHSARTSRLATTAPASDVHGVAPSRPRSAVSAYAHKPYASHMQERPIVFRGGSQGGVRQEDLERMLHSRAQNRRRIARAQSLHADDVNRIPYMTRPPSRAASAPPR